MIRLPGLATLALFSTGAVCWPSEAHDEAIRRVAEANDSRAVRLTYLGDAGGGLGEAAPAVTGWRLNAGWVLTSLYAIEREPAAILCRLPSGESVAATVTGRDYSRRIALLRLALGAESAPSIDGRPARVGETAITLGRAFDLGTSSVTVGVISAVGRLGGRAVQTDAAASPINYGGPLLGIDGQLLGILSPLAPPGQSGVGLYDSGVGFAVSVDQIAERLPQLARGADVRAGWLGASFSNESPLRAAAVIMSVAPGGPAELSGLAPGDVITGLAGKATPTLWALRNTLRGLDAGERVSVETGRPGRAAATAEVVLGERPPSDEADPTVEAGLQRNQPDES